VFEHTSDADHSLEDADDIRPWQYTDLPYLQELAGSLSESTRYHTDSQFDTGNCDELHSLWIHHVCQEAADEVFVAIADGVPVGFSMCTVTDGVGEVGLVGVEETVSDETVGTRLLTAAVEWCRDHNLTQASGTPQTASDQQTYRSAGFTPTAERYVLHRWFDSDTNS
jgi:GNAT superfamily N-acetyltransferase